MQKRNLSFLSLSFILSFFLMDVELNYSSTSPIVKISPECGTLKDHRINFTVNGFNSNGNIYWEFINSTGVADTFGYFDSNDTGGFNDYIIADSMQPDNYTLRFFDDKNNDYIKDIDGKEIIINYEIPCNSVFF
ncbi:MAG TPA: hypothetical protein VFM28_04595 [Nitrososphaeraceae archaeon]|nr:hypothetical protein [Nitrososphaeraceae archaeon]